MAMSLRIAMQSATSTRTSPVGTGMYARNNNSAPPTQSTFCFVCFVCFACGFVYVLCVCARACVRVYVLCVCVYVYVYVCVRVCVCVPTRCCALLPNVC